MHTRGVKALWFCLFLAVVVILCYVPFVSAADMQHFSADMVTRSGRQTQNAKIYVSGQKTRMEMPFSIMIMRLDRKVSWMLLPSQESYIEQTLDSASVPKTSRKVEGEVERVPIGKETVNGVATEKFNVTYMEGGRKVSMYQWLTKAGFPIKLEAVDGSWGVEYKNIFFGPQPDSLFEPPSGYQKMSMPFGGGSKMEMPSMDDFLSQMEQE